MPTPTLVVVDMQSTFKAALNIDVIVGVSREIVETKARNGAIIIVEYAGCDSTHQGILNLLAGYRDKARVIKRDDDGSAEILSVLRRRGFYGGHLRVCGVNTDCCVAATVDGLLSRDLGMRVDVVKSACEWAGKKRFDWRQYKRHPNLALV